MFPIRTSNIYMRVLSMSCSLWISISFRTSCCFINSLHLPTQSDSDSQTDPLQAHNSASGCNATPSLGRHIGFADEKVGKRYPLRSFRSLVCPNCNTPRTKPDCLHHQSSHVGCRFGRNGGSGFASGFRLRHWCGCVLVPRVRSFRDRCKYRYICRPKRIRFPLRGRLKGRNCIGTYCTHHARIKNFIYVTPCWRW